jgi:hypothetical protein
MNAWFRELWPKIRSSIYIIIITNNTVLHISPNLPDAENVKQGNLMKLWSFLKADFQSSHEAPRSSLRVHA